VKSLLLLRHGKSDWNADYDNDHDRPLAKRGIKSAKLIGRFLTRMEQIPDRVLTSSAARARGTAELAIKVGGWSCPVEVVPDFYGAGTDEVLERVRACADSVKTLLIVGHEPTWLMLVARLTGGCEVEFATAALARIELPIDNWKDASFGHGILLWFVPPRLLDRIDV
jgi:phosphohistidine phosphatase